MKTFTKYILLSFMLSVGLTACDQGFEEMNKNPNAPEVVAPGLLLPNIIRSTSNTLVDRAFIVGNITVQYSTMTGANAYDRYEWDSNMGPWNSFYAILKDVNNLELLAKNSSHENYEGIAIILRTLLFSVLTDCYGDIPYFDVGKAKTDNIYQTRYDAQADIYASLISALEVANSKLGPNSGVIDGDILFQGQHLKWKKFGNSLRIRLLMRTEKKAATTVGSKITEILSNPDQFPIFQSNADNTALQYLPDFPNQWPMLPLRPADLKERKLSATLEQRLKMLNDPRLSIYAAPTPSSVADGTPEYVGVPNGLTEGTGAGFNGGSSYQSEIGALFYYVPNSAKGVLMHYAELMFLLAEASYKGIITGDTEDYYNKGVLASLGQYGLQPGDYLTSDGVMFDPENGLDQIAVQKWISLFYVGLEAWLDWRRTGLPEIIPGPANVNNDRVPIRIPYPILEQSLNSKNYTDAVARQGADDINTKMWLLQ